MRPRISIRGSVRPSIRPSVRPSVRLAFFFYTKFVPKWLNIKGKVKEWTLGYPGHLYMRVCLSVCPSVGPSVARFFFRTSGNKWKRHRSLESRDMDP